MPKIATGTGLLALLAACQTGAGTNSAIETAFSTEGPPNLVIAICGDCHAVTADAISPNPQAPGFADIANSPGVTRATLIAFLSDAHNYPMQMDVDLDDEDIETIAHYMLTLQSDDYAMPPS